VSRSPTLKEDRGVVVALRGTRQVVVKLDVSGREFVAGRTEPSSRLVVVGDRVRLLSRGTGSRNVAMLDEAKSPGAPTSPSRPALRPLPETLRRAVDAAVAAGESPMTIAARHGISVDQVRA
jgi:hypothetical protein